VHGGARMQRAPAAHLVRRPPPAKASSWNAHRDPRSFWVSASVLVWKRSLDLLVGPTHLSGGAGVLCCAVLCSAYVPSSLHDFAALDGSMERGLYIGCKFRACVESAGLAGWVDVALQLRVKI
jgi:hypothetical protein